MNNNRVLPKNKKLIIKINETVYTEGSGKSYTRAAIGVNRKGFLTGHLTQVEMMNEWMTMVMFKCVIYYAISC
jgi:hypothetical protein